MKKKATAVFRILCAVLLAGALSLVLTTPLLPETLHPSDNTSSQPSSTIDWTQYGTQVERILLEFPYTGTYAANEQISGTVQLVQTTDTAPPIYTGTDADEADEYRGTFELCFLRKSGLPSRLELNELFGGRELVFPKNELDRLNQSYAGGTAQDFRLMNAQDFNNDQNCDLLIGQPAADGDGNDYVPVAINSDGRLTALPVENGALHIAGATPAQQLQTLEEIYEADYHNGAQPHICARIRVLADDGTTELQYPEYYWDGTQLAATGQRLTAPNAAGFPYVIPTPVDSHPVQSVLPTGITHVLAQKIVSDLYISSANDLFALTSDGEVYYYGTTLPVQLRTQEMVKLPFPEKIVRMAAYCFVGESNTVYFYEPAFSTLDMAAPTELTFLTVSLPPSEHVQKLLPCAGDLFILTREGTLYSVGELGLYGDGLNVNSYADWANVPDYMKLVRVSANEKIDDIGVIDNRHLVVLPESHAYLETAPLFYHLETALHLRKMWSGFPIAHLVSPLHTVSLVIGPNEQDEVRAIDGILPSGLLLARTADPDTVCSVTRLNPLDQEMLQMFQSHPENLAHNLADYLYDYSYTAFLCVRGVSGAEAPRVTAYVPDRYVTLSNGTTLLLFPDASWRVSKLDYLYWIGKSKSDTTAEQVVYSDLFACNRDYLQDITVVFSGDQQLIYRDADGNLCFIGEDPLHCWSDADSYSADQPLILSWLRVSVSAGEPQLVYGSDFWWEKEEEEAEQNVSAELSLPAWAGESSDNLDESIFDARFGDMY